MVRGGCRRPFKMIRGGCRRPFKNEKNLLLAIDCTKSNGKSSIKSIGQLLETSKEGDKITIVPIHARTASAAEAKTGGTFTSNTLDNVAARPEPFVSLIAYGSPASKKSSLATVTVNKFVLFLVID